MIQELYEFYKENFPFIVRNEYTVIDILKNKNNKIIEKRDENGKLIGVSVINENTVILFCVDKKCRNKGLGSGLLELSEQTVKKDGYYEIVIGAGFDYLMPGVPTNKKYFKTVNEDLYSDVDSSAAEFFTKRGYKHSWDCDCFDMRFDLKYFTHNEHTIGETIDGIAYRWAEAADIDSVCECCDDAEEEFTQYYKNEEMYKDGGSERVLTAVFEGETVGALICNKETEGEGLGSVACTVVKRSFQRRRIATNLVTLGTGYLKEAGMKEAYLGYTYTGLDNLYGYAGYKICIYYMIAKKRLG